MELTSARTKLRRAQEHFETLKAETGAWTSGNSNSVRIESNAEGTRHRFVVSIQNAPDADRWGCLIGDCVHNLRSALDHVIWQLSGPAPPEFCEFPIFASPVRRPTGELQPGFNAKIRGITKASVRDFIEVCQPCNAADPPKRGVLWVLHRIDIVDKHKILIACLLEHLDPGDMNIRLRFADDSPVIGPPHTFIKNSQPVSDGDTLLTILNEGRVEHVEADINFALQVGIDARDLGVDLGRPFGPIPDLLGELGAAVDSVIGEIESLTA